MFDSVVGTPLPEQSPHCVSSKTKIPKTEKRKGWVSFRQHIITESPLFLVSVIVSVVSVQF